MKHLFTRDAEPERAKASRSFDEIIAVLDATGSVSNAGKVINTTTAMQQATVWACVRVLAEVIAQLPIYMQERRSGRWVDVDDHEALAVIAEPNDWMSRHELIAHLVIWAELRGNGYFHKASDERERVRVLHPLVADAVEVTQRRDWSLTYNVNSQNGFSGQFGPGEIFHYRNFGSNGYVGLSTISNLRNSIGLALRAEEHGARLFQNGAQLSQHFKLSTTNKVAIDVFKDELLKQYQGAENAHRPFVTGGNVDVTTLGMTNSDAQFLETRKLQKQEIAGAFGVPLFIINDTERSTTWGTGLEQQLRAFKTLSLGPRLNRLASTLSRELLTPNERRRMRFQWDTDELTASDFKERMEGYRTAVETGLLTPNEAREIEGFNPRDGGDEFRIPVNIAIEGSQPAPAAPAAPVAEVPDDDQQDEVSDPTVPA